MQYFKNDTKEVIYKTQTDSLSLKKTYGYQRRKGGRDGLGVWTGTCTLLSGEGLLSRDPQYSSGNSTEPAAIVYMGKESEKESL